MKKKILILDDEKAIAELVKLKLERHGFEVFVALDGLEGFEMLQRIKPDLIILDVLMPRMDGYQFYKKMKASKGVADTPILVTTARGAMRDTFEGLGVESFLSKPFEPDDLLTQVNKILTSFSKKTPLAKSALIAGYDHKKLTIMQEQLEKKGYTVQLATSGPKALEKALEILPDLFVVQFDMPEMSADEIVKELDCAPAAKKISIVVYSLLRPEDKDERSKWEYFISQDQKKKMRAREAPLKIVDKFDVHSFLDRIQEFL